MTSDATRPGRATTGTDDFIWMDGAPPTGDPPVERTTVRLQRIPFRSPPTGDSGSGSGSGS
ncbi:hypothetical protein, partial [Frankia sp. CiP1_Cm_nod2]